MSYIYCISVFLELASKENKQINNFTRHLNVNFTIDSSRLPLPNMQENLKHYLHNIYRCFELLLFFFNQLFQHFLDNLF